MQEQRHCLICLVLSVFITACNFPSLQPDLACDWILDPAVQSMHSEIETLAPNQIVQRIRTAFQVEKADVGIDQYSDKEFTARYSWEANGKEYVSSFAQDELVRLRVVWHTAEPTVSQFLECFGPPAWYRASYFQVAHGDELKVELWYPDQGIVATHYQFVTSGERTPPPVAPTDQMKYLMLVRPGSLEAVTERTFRDFSREQRSQMLQSMKPWPGDVGQFQVERAWP